MDKADIVKAIMDEIEKKQLPAAKAAPQSLSQICGLTEFVGTAIGDTIGLVIPNVDNNIQEKLGIDKKYRSLGIVGARTGAGPQAMAADEAVKSSNTQLLKFEMPRDTKGGGGHGCLAVFGADEVSDVKRAVEITLATLPGFFGDIYMNEAGHVEAQYTARASSVLAENFNAPLGKAWGLLSACPAAIGMVMADTAVKSADVEVVMQCSPAKGTSYSNEFIIMFSGDSGAVKQAAMTGRDIAVQLLATLGSKPTSSGTPYII